MEIEGSRITESFLDSESSHNNAAMKTTLPVSHHVDTPPYANLFVHCVGGRPLCCSLRMAIVNEADMTCVFLIYVHEFLWGMCRKVKLQAGT